MAEADQKTEEATPRRREKMVEEGQIIRSADVGAAAVVIAACFTISMTFETLGSGLVAFTRRIFRLVDTREPLQALHAQLDALTPLALPLVAAAVAAAIAGVAQARVFSLSLLGFKPERLDPLTNLAQLVPSKTTMLELAKQVAKLLAIGMIAYRVIADAMPMFSTLSAAAPLDAASTVVKVAGKLAMRVGGAFVVAAAVDYYLARRKYMQDAMMSREEVRDENKEQEGRPEVRARMRRKMKEMAKGRKIGDVAKATVVVVNPTHYAVALRYEPEEDFAPIVLAKGIDQLALEMRTHARREGVPVVEQPPLARALYANGKIGRAIPVEQYRAVAEVIAYVMGLKARDAGVRRGQS
ncbi:MAG TPA: EscU/YscU/HrcU family type III secretion system export apparatus switch protein [Polyangiales bacterium]|nr:EscU/YscU/HrcU family type III secretion system export apparatus switch protein [Polyangiales bacterium]